MDRANDEVTPEGVAAVEFLLNEPQYTFLMLAIALEIRAMRAAEQGDTEQCSGWRILSEKASELCEVVKVMQGQYGQVLLHELRETARRQGREVPW
jgi:hypothetical protein